MSGFLKLLALKIQTYYLISFFAQLQKCQNDKKQVLGYETSGLLK